MFRLLEQAAMGVWLSTLISRAVTAATPIITATVNSQVTTINTLLPELAAKH